MLTLNSVICSLFKNLHKFVNLVLLLLTYRPLTKEDILNSKIRDLKDKNASLSRVNSEMQRELKEVSVRSPDENKNLKERVMDVKFV